jgi:hypothetical protein
MRLKKEENISGMATKRMEQKKGKARRGSADVFMTKPQPLERRLIIPALKNTATFPL